MSYFKQTALRGLFAMSCLTLVGSIGCGSGQTAVVKPDVARQTLEKVLASWKEGELPGAWQEHDPKVVVQDFDWTAGAKLLGFEILGPGEARDANLYCKVKLSLEKEGKKAKERTVTYVVGTDPVLTVFREMP